MLIAKAFSGSTTRLYRPDGEQIGVLRIAPRLGAPRNGRLRGSKDDVATIELGGTTYRLEWEILHEPSGRRGARWLLMDGADTRATGTAGYGDRKRRWEVDLAGARYALVARGRWSRLRFDLIENGVRVGGVSETTRMFSLARSYEVTSPPALGGPVQAFLLHLATRTSR